MRHSFEMMRPDKRKIRADAVASHVMHRISDMLYKSDVDGKQNLPKKVHEAILEILMAEGIEVLTDYDRMLMSLPARDAFGWTDDEIKVYENRKLEAMLKSFPHMIISDQKTQCPKCGEVHRV